jgi:hypothetical protein
MGESFVSMEVAKEKANLGIAKRVKQAKEAKQGGGKEERAKEEAKKRAKEETKRAKATLNAEKAARNLAALNMPKSKAVAWYAGTCCKWKVVYWFNGSARHIGYYDDRHTGAAAV